MVEVMLMMTTTTERKLTIRMVGAELETASVV
jgi:hypothetical protein